MSSFRAGKPERWLWLIVLLFSALLLSVVLSARSLWNDEMFTTLLLPQTLGKLDLATLAERCAFQERRPPLYFVLIYYWGYLMGDGEIALRFPSFFFGVLSLPLLGHLARRIGMARAGLAAPVLLAISPSFIMYGRMGRPYTFLLAAGLLSAITFVAVLHHPSPRAWAGYMAASLVVLYSDYALLSLLLAQNLYVTYCLMRARRVALRAWILSQVILAVLFIPSLSILISQAAGKYGAADLNAGLAGPVIRGVYLLYAISAGETTWPWQPVAIIGLVCAAAAAIVGLLAVVRRERAGQNDHGAVLLLFLVVPVISMAPALSVLANDLSFVYMPSRMLFVIPYYVLLLGSGLLSLPRPAWRVLVTAGLVAAWTVALLNYYGNRNFQNPVYAMPSREVIQQILSEAQPGDVIVAEYDTITEYYYKRSAAQYPPVPFFRLWSFALWKDRDQSALAQETITTKGSPRVWLITLGRDKTRLVAMGDQFAAWLAQSYMLQNSRGSMKEDETYQRLKQALLERPDYEYKMLVRLYVRQ